MRVPPSRCTFLPSDETVDTTALSTLAAASVKPFIPITPRLFGPNEDCSLRGPATRPSGAPFCGALAGGPLRPIGDVCVVPIFAVLSGGPASADDAEKLAGDANA